MHFYEIFLLLCMYIMKNRIKNFRSIVQSVIYLYTILKLTEKKSATFFVKARVLKLNNTLFGLITCFTWFLKEYTWVNWCTCDTFETSSFVNSILESVQNFLIKLDMKPCMHLQWLHPIIFVSNVFHNSHLIQKCIQNC